MAHFRKHSALGRAATVRSRVPSHGETCIGAPNGSRRRKSPPSHDGGSGRRLAALALALLVLPLAGGAGPQETGDAAAVPDQVRAHLAAAHRARSQLGEEKEAWAAEKERLELLVSAVRRRAQRLKAEAEKARADRDDLREDVEALSAKKARLEAVEALLDSLAERLEKGLEALADGSLPGLVPADTAAGVTDPARRFDAAVARLEETEARLGTATVEIVTGSLDGREVTVRLLRVGGAAAWWTSLDGRRAGVARQAGDGLALTPADSPDARDAIRKAFAVAEGRAAPDWTLLPAGHLEMKE